MLARYIPVLGLRLSLRSFVSRNNLDVEKQRKDTLLANLRSKIVSNRLKRKNKGSALTGLSTAHASVE